MRTCTHRTRFQSKGRMAIVGGLLALGLGGTAAAEGFASLKVTLLDHIGLGGFPSNPSSGSDCWGYVSPSGREYALMGLREAVAVVEITDPAGPVLIAEISHSNSNWCDIKTYETYCYAVNETGGGLDVIDLSQVDAGIVTLVQRVTEGGLNTCHNLFVNEDSGYLYLLSPGQLSNQGRLTAMSLADPANPIIAGMVPITGNGVVHDAQVVTYTSGPYAGREIAFCAAGSDHLEIYDVTDKADMVKLAVGVYPNMSYTHQCWLSEDRQYLYINDETDNINETVIMDVSKIDDPQYVGAYTTGLRATDHNVFFHEGFIYEAEYRAGMRVFDASDPLHPVEVGWIDTFPGDDSSGSGGVWGVYPFFPSGKVIIGDKNRGLFVVWPDDPPINFDIPGGPPDRIDPGGDGSFLVDVTAERGHVLDPFSPVLVYDIGDGPVELPMTHLAGDTFQASFGAIECGSFVSYHVRAATVDGVGIRSPVNAPCESFVAIAAIDSTTIISDEFEFDAGWTAGLPGDNAVGGVWTRVEPNGTSTQTENDRTPAPGEECFITGQNFTGVDGDDDVDQGSTTLLSPPLDLTGADRATIGYWRWYHNSFYQIDGDEGTHPNEDIFVISVSSDDGKTWTTVETVGPDGPETSGGWILHAFDVGEFVELTSQVRVKFVATDIGGLSIVEAGVDDFIVVAVECDEAIPGDINGDGLVNPADLAIVLGSWGPCPGCPADLNGDGIVGPADLAIVLGNWS